MKKIKNQKGFTLIELLLYVSTVSVILLFVSIFLSSLLQSRVKNQTVSEVEGQGIQVMQLINQTIRNAKDVDSPTAGLSSESLRLDVVDSALEPTIFNLNNGTIFVSEGSNNEIALTNSRVIISNLTFENYSDFDTLGTVRTRFTISHINPENRNEFNYERTFIGSATLRNHP